LSQAPATTPHWYASLPPLPASVWRWLLPDARALLERYAPNLLPALEAHAQDLQGEGGRRVLLLLREGIVCRRGSAAKTLARFDEAMLALVMGLAFEGNPDQAKHKAEGLRILGRLKDPLRTIRRIVEKPQATRRPQGGYRLVAIGGRRAVRHWSPSADLNGYELVLVYERVKHVLGRARTLRKNKSPTLAYDPQKPPPWVNPESPLFPNPYLTSAN